MLGLWGSVKSLLRQCRDGFRSLKDSPRYVSAKHIVVDTAAGTSS